MRRIGATRHGWTFARQFSAWLRLVRVIAHVAFSFILAATVSGQGFILFNNRVANMLNAPVYGAEPSGDGIAKTGNTPAGLPAGSQTYDGVLLSDSGYTAQVFAGPLGTSDEDLQPLLPATFFRTGLNAGLILPPSGPIQVPGVPVGARARAQVRVWENQGGAITTWPQLLATPGALRGVSVPFDSPPLGAMASPTPLAGLTSFNLHALAMPGYPMVTMPPPSQTTNAGSFVTFGVTVAGIPPFSYQWRKNGTDLTDATNAMLMLPNVQVPNSGYYTVAISNSLGAAISSAALLNVSNRPLLTSPQFSLGTNFEFTLRGETGRVYVVEATDALSNWTTLATLSVVTGETQFTATNALVNTRRFYRARLVPD